MPRGPRLDAPETPHHVMVRGIEGRAIFREEQDRDEFVRRVGEVAIAMGLTVYAWALLPNHVHLLVRIGAIPLARSMRSLVTGYAGSCNRRHRRRGHLFQNRYKSIVVEAAPYLLELVRYIHRNPVRAKILPDLRGRERHPYTGHAALLGHRRYPWQATRTVMGNFAQSRPRARADYRALAVGGYSGARLAPSLGVRLPAIHKAAQRGREARNRWEQVLKSITR